MSFFFIDSCLSQSLWLLLACPISNLDLFTLAKMIVVNPTQGFKLFLQKSLGDITDTTFRFFYCFLVRTTNQVPNINSFMALH